MHISNWRWTTIGCTQIWEITKSVGSMVNCGINRYVEHLEIQMSQMVLRGNTHNCRCHHNYMDWSSGILACTIQKPRVRFRVSRVGTSTIYLTLGNHTIGGLHIRTSEMVLPATSQTLCPWLANHPYCVCWYQSLATFRRFVVVSWFLLKNNRFVSQLFVVMWTTIAPPFFI